MHNPVLLEEAIDALHVQDQAQYIDATLGAGGHSVEIIKRGGKLLGLDQDSEMLKVARKNIELACPPHKSNFAGRYTLVNANFRDIAMVAKVNKFMPVNGILMDLGISSLHLDLFERGFSFKRESEPLDMRLDKNLGVTAADLLNVLDKKALMRLFESGLNYPDAKRTVEKIIDFRQNKKIVTVQDFLKVNADAKAFMALRIAVNSELETLKETLPKAFDLLANKGRLVVISFHSGEDKIVKDFFTSKKAQAKIITKKPIVSTQEEIANNPRAKSAKMRVLEKNEENKKLQNKVNKEV